MRIAKINTETNIVENVFIGNNISSFSQEGYYFIESEVGDSQDVGVANIGDTYKNNTFFIDYNIEESKHSKISQLKASINYEEPVEVNGVSYIGGYDSAQKLDSKRRLVLESGGSTVEYIDENDDIVSLSLEDAKSVCLAVANDYEAKFYLYKMKKKAIENCSTVEELENIIDSLGA